MNRKNNQFCHYYSSCSILNYMWTSIGAMLSYAMSLHMAFLTESKAAYFTLKRLFLGMNSTMSTEKRA
jgi:hypothetical protein